MWSRSCPELKWWLGRGLAVLVMALLAQVPSAQAEDPLDEKDGTEDWDQVIGGKRQPKQQKQDAKQAQKEFKQQISEWESIRLLWTGEREGYLLEKALHNQLAAQYKAVRRAAPPPPVQGTDAGGSRAADQPSSAWGDDLNGPMFVPGSSLDKAIDGELSGSGKASKAGQGAGKAGQPSRGGTSAELPPDGGEMPSAFRQPVRKEDDSGHMGGPAPVNKAEDEDVKAAAREMKEQKAAEEQRRLAEEQKRKDEEERRKREEQEAKVKKAAEEDDGAAAAAKFLKEQEEKQRKEQEALQKKAKLKTDSEGQVVDPELQKESGDESP